MNFAEDEFQFGRLGNVFYFLGRLETGSISEIDSIQVAVVAEYCRADLEKFGFPASVRALNDVIGVLNGTHPTSGYQDPRSILPTYVTVLRSSLMAELEATLFLPVEFSVSRYYREPRRDWDEVIQRFPDSVSDIEEAGKCYALGRYAACVFHCMQVMEHGLLALGEFMELADPKSGFTAVANALERVKGKRYQDLTDFERQHFAFFEQMNGSVQAIKDAWRNKVNHAQGKLTLVTADFSPAVAIEIYMATRGFMRRLATDLPKKRRWLR